MEPSPTTLTPSLRNTLRETSTDSLVALGLETAAKLLTQREQAIEAWGLAYAHFPFITPQQIEQFKLLCEKEFRQSPRGYRKKKTLKFTQLKNYPAVPPTEVLDKLKAAQDLKIFNTFEIAHIEWYEVLPDPILFGLITNCPDYFLIAQWGEDVSFEDLHK